MQIRRMIVIIQFTAAKLRNTFNGQDLIKIANLMPESTLFPAFPQVFPKVGRAEDGCTWMCMYMMNVLGFSPDVRRRHYITALRLSRQG